MVLWFGGSVVLWFGIFPVEASIGRSEHPAVVGTDGDEVSLSGDGVDVDLFRQALVAGFPFLRSGGEDVKATVISSQQ
jgi:hypothetical protein